MVVDAFGDVFVADTGDDRIVELSPQGALLAVWHRAGPRDVGFHEPAALALAADGALYVLDAGNDRVVVLGIHGERLTAGLGRSGEQDLRRPAGIAVDGSGDAFVSDSAGDRVVEFGPGDRRLRSWGGGGTGRGRLSGPSGLAIDCHGDLLVADTHNNRIDAFMHVAAAPRAGRCPTSARGLSQGYLALSPTGGMRMRDRSFALIFLLVTLSLGGGAGTALASKRASRSQVNAVTQAVNSSPVGGINKVPRRRYTVTRVRLSTLSPAWAMASLVPTKAFRNRFQSASVVAVQPAGTRRWVVVDLGSAEVGCGIAPNVVLADLLGLRSGESPCPPGEGIT